MQATRIYIKQPATTLFLIQSVPYDQYEVRAAHDDTHGSRHGLTHASGLDCSFVNDNLQEQLVMADTA